MPSRCAVAARCCGVIGSAQESANGAPGRGAALVAWWSPRSGAASAAAPVPVGLRADVSAGGDGLPRLLSGGARVRAGFSALSMHGAWRAIAQVARNGVEPVDTLSADEKSLRTAVQCPRVNRFAAKATALGTRGVATRWLCTRSGSGPGEASLRPDPGA